MIKQVTSVSATASTILTPGRGCHVLSIQNNGSGNVRLSLDGGVGYTNGQTGGTGTNPTATTGYRLAAGQPFNMTLLGDKNVPPIVAILESGTTTTLDITTDDTLST